MTYKTILQYENIISAISRRYQIASYSWEDIRQEILLKLLTCPLPTKNTESFIRKTANNLAIDLYRKANQDAMSKVDFHLRDCYKKDGIILPYNNLTNGDEFSS